MLSFVVGVGSIPPLFELFIMSLVPQDVLVVAFLITVSKTKVIPTFAATPENSAGLVKSNAALKSWFKRQFEIDLCIMRYSQLRCDTVHLQLLGFQLYH
jgi:hypothetical protein